VITLAEDTNNDLTLGLDGNLALASGVDAVMQVLRSACETQRGELIYDVAAGIPNFEVVWGGTPNLAQMEAALRATALQVGGVLGVESITSEAVGGVAKYTLTVRTQYGQGAVNG
jgi:hypothetical protein